jgi:O-antigen ligase
LSATSEVLDRWCERGILALVLAIVVFGPLATGAVRALEFLIIQGCTLGVMALWAGRWWLSRRTQLLWPPICWAVVAFALYAIACYRRAEIEYVAREELIRVLVYAFLFLAILNNLHRQELTQTVSLTLIGVGVVGSFVAFYQFVAGSTKVPSLGGLLESLSYSDKSWLVTTPYQHRGVGTYINPNHQAGFLEMLLPLGLAYTLASRIKPLGKVFTGYAAGVLLAGIAVTVSRGAWVSTVVALMIFFGVLMGDRRHRLPSFVLLAVILGAGVVFVSKSYFFQTRLRQLVSQGKVDDDARFDLWVPAVKIWRENVWWGGGPAHFDYRFRSYRPEGVQMQPRRVHNDFLNTLADWGVVGTALVASAWVLLGVGVAKTWRSVRGPPRQLGEEKRSNKFAFVLGSSLGLAAILFHSMVDFNMHIPANAIVTITLMALLTSHLRFATERYWVTLSGWLKVTATAIVMAGLIYLSHQGWRRAAEYVWLQRAAHAPSFSPAQVERLKKAFEVEPLNAATAAEIGEALRIQSQEGGEDYRQLADQALGWFGRSIKLNPWEGNGLLGYGWCLDWAGRRAESAPYFDRAEQLDPNNYFTMTRIGLHYVELGNYAAAKPWFERSLRLQWENNPIAHDYAEIANRRMLRAATNEINAQLSAP